eukprot:8732502-Heterocapsa_arctica.AAC.1
MPVSAHAKANSAFIANSLAERNHSEGFVYSGARMVSSLWARSAEAAQAHEVVALVGALVGRAELRG